LGNVKVGLAFAKAASVGIPALIASEGKTAGLGLEDDLFRLRGTGAVTWEEGGWQRAGLTKVDVGMATRSRYWLEVSLGGFKEGGFSPV